MSAVKQTTLTPSSVSQRVMVQLSSPPDAAKATVLPLRAETVVRIGNLLVPRLCLGTHYPRGSASLKQENVNLIREGGSAQGLVLFVKAKRR